MTTFFTADTHFGHANIIKYCTRPFATSKEMDAAMIKNWNETVKQDDEVYHLGDFVFVKTYTKALEILVRLNGRIHFVWGNHDNDELKTSAVFNSSQYAAEIELDGHHITLCHYPMAAWNHSHHGSLMFHGHTHGSTPKIPNRFDVGVDVCGFKPVTLQELLASQ
jgi:calcineurin-like phosphoesterase family protein